MGLPVSPLDGQRGEDAASENWKAGSTHEALFTGARPVGIPLFALFPSPATILPSFVSDFS